MINEARPTGWPTGRHQVACRGGVGASWPVNEAVSGPRTSELPPSIPRLSPIARVAVGPAPLSIPIGPSLRRIELNAEKTFL